jgi:hypothetical protein
MFGSGEAQSDASGMPEQRRYVQAAHVDILGSDSCGMDFDQDFMIFPGTASAVVGAGSQLSGSEVLPGYQI